MKHLVAAVLIAWGAVVVSAPTLSAQDVATGGGAVKLVRGDALERFVRGKLDACELTYTVAFEDHIYRQGGISFLRGALSFVGLIDSPMKPPAIIFKVTAFDVHGQTTKLSALSYAYLTTAAQSYAGKELKVGPSEDGGLLVIYEFLKYPDLAFSLDGPIQLNITRKGGGSDVRIPMNFQRDNAEMAFKHGKCVLSLIDAIKSKFSG